jgi:hypothetical protein
MKKLACILLFLATNSIAQKSPEQTIDEIIEQWVGQYDNHQHVAANIAMGGPTAPEFTHEKREIIVEKISAPQFGKNVLFLEEYRQTLPNLASRQRVMSLVWDEIQKKVRIIQYFFKTGSYDRKPLKADFVAKLPLTDFDLIGRCDLFFEWDEKNKRYRAGMTPQACTYEHQVDGPVYADYEMLLYPNQMWYRDRSIRQKNGTIRGEIDGFSWLRFDKKTNSLITKQTFEAHFPVISKQIGTWKGRFRRYDADGKLTADFVSEITVKLDLKNKEKPYQQTNKYTYEDGRTQTIESSGRIEGDKLIFENAQIEGWANDPSADTNKNTTLMYMKYKDGTGLYVYEIITVSDDGKQRSRATQYMKDGKTIRRTLIDEVKTE